MIKRLSKEEVEREIAALGTLDTKALQEKWSALYDRGPPSRIRAGLLRLGIAYRLQEKAFGGLKPQTVRLLKKLASELRAARTSTSGENEVCADVSVRPSVVQTLTLTPGTRLMREWNGVTEVVDVVVDGLVWRGTTYRTLSSVAGAITGTKWSGPKFFGLTPPKPKLRGPRRSSPTERVAEVS